MAMTLVELMGRMSQLDETVVVELLDLNSADIVDRFSDIVEEKFEYLIKEVGDYGEEAE